MAELLNKEIEESAGAELDDAVLYTKGVGSATLYRVNNKTVTVPQHIHYLYRSKVLGQLSLYEYGAIVRVVPKKKPKRTQEGGKGGIGADVGVDTGVDIKVDGDGRGCTDNAMFEFDVGHPLQMLMSKQATPVKI
jgi:hypothetical protein